LGTLFVAFLQRCGLNTKKLSTLQWRSGDDLQNFWIEQLGESWQNLFKQELWIIIDEAQKLYTLTADHQFWQDVKELLQQEVPKCHILFLAAYGEATIIGHVSTPITFPFYWDLGHLRLSKPEFDDVLSGYHKSTDGKVLPLSIGMLYILYRYLASIHLISY
jgi:hypothetical protein